MLKKDESIKLTIPGLDANWHGTANVGDVLELTSLGHGVTIHPKSGEFMHVLAVAFNGGPTKLIGIPHERVIYRLMESLQAIRQQMYAEPPQLEESQDA